MAEAQERIRAEVPIPAGSWLEWGGQFENLISAAQRLQIEVPRKFVRRHPALASANTRRREALTTCSQVGRNQFSRASLYVAGDAAWSLFRREEPEKSWSGIVLSIVSLIVMPLLARAKRRVAAACRAARSTLILARRHLRLSSAILLGGLLLNALLGWWWADSVAALLMVPVILREAFEAFRGETCDVC